MTNRADPGGATDVQPIDGLWDKVGKKVTITNSSQTIEQLLGFPIPDDAGGITLSNPKVQTVFYQADGSDADDTAFPLASTSRTVPGDKAQLDNIRLISGAGNITGFGIMIMKAL